MPDQSYWSQRSPSGVLHAFVLIDAEPTRTAALATEIADINGVTEVFSVAGGVADLIAIVRVRQHEDLVDVVTGKLATLDGIESTTTLVAFKAYSRHDLEAIWDLGPSEQAAPMVISSAMSSDSASNVAASPAAPTPRRRRRRRSSPPQAQPQ